MKKRITLCLVLLLFPWTGCDPSRSGNELQSPPRSEPGPTAQPTSVRESPPTAFNMRRLQWPQWRGPEANGISRETAWRTNWNEQSPRELWRSELGLGYSSFAVVDGRVYTMGHQDRRETVWCLDAETGEKVWSHSYPGALNDNLHTGGPAATPTVHGDRVYTLGKEGQLHCFNRGSGEVVWKHHLPQMLEVPVPEWGFSCSPLVVGEKLIIDAGRTVALRADNGELVWKTEPFQAGYGSPAAFAGNGEMLLAVLNNDALLILRSNDGSIVAQQPWTSDFVTTATTPIVDGTRIFISTGYNNGCAMYDLDGDRLLQVYRNRNMSNHMNNCVLWEGHLYGFDGNSHNARNVRLVCLDAGNGEVKWSQRGLGCGSLMIAGGKLLALSDDGRLVVAKASPESYQPLAEHRVLDTTCWTVPVLCDGRIYCRNDGGQAVCVDVRSTETGTSSSGP